jgi:hypothetical protein
MVGVLRGLLDPELVVTGAVRRALDQVHAEIRATLG